MNNIRSNIIPTIITVLLLFGGATVHAREKTADNVLLLTVDTLRSDRLSGYGYQHRTSPRIDALMARGVKFEHAYTVVPLTAPSFASVMMSRYPHETGLTRNGLKVQVKFPAMPELFRKAGLVTGCIQSNWTIRGAMSGLDRGFDHYDDGFVRPRTVVTERDGKVVTELSIKWMDERIDRGERFFMWVHYSDPHSPYLYRRNYKLPHLPGEKDLTPSYRYDTEVRFVDHQIGLLLDHMKKRGILDNTLIFFTADHGESLGEHGYFGHGRQIYEQMLRIPMAIVGPGIKQAVSGNRVQLVDVMPTLLERAGIKAPGGIRGRPLVDADGAPSSFNRDTCFYETYRGAVPKVPGARKIMPGVKPLKLGMRRGPLKLIYSPDNGEIELYDIEADPGETNNLYGTYRDKAMEMARKIENWYASTNPHAPGKKQKVSKENEDRLRALGYIE